MFSENTQNVNKECKTLFYLGLIKAVLLTFLCRLSLYSFLKFIPQLVPLLASEICIFASRSKL